ncbi:MAG: ATP-binding cassette domain-containing protein [Acidobacteria bacterium]|nr:ATP-binding cassette domain-containing protein [Acidobacteriota bacterium]
MAVAEPIIEARGVEKFYVQPDGHRIEVIAPTDLAIDPDKIIALLGPSGSGKSTLLRMLTGLAPPSAGKVLWHGQPLDSQPPNASIVFQSFALFPWLTVLENVEAPLKARGIGTIERRKRALKILDTVGLDGYETAYPKELSGGMKQRVGFARALVVEPEVLFMDEAFSALDVLTEETLRGELLELWLSKKIPTRAIFMVTHNIEEAVLLMLLGTQWYILFNVTAGAVAIPTDLKEATAVFRFSKADSWRWLKLPGIFPYLVTGLVTASGGAWNASIVAEYFHFQGQILSTTGLGATISHATDAGNFDVLLAATIVMAAIVVTMNRLVWRRLYRLAETRFKLEA